MVIQDRPNLKPEWAVDPTTPATAIVEPAQADKDEGDLPDTNPRRTYHNWFKNLAHQWVQWFDNSYRRTTDAHPDQALPFGTVPSTGVGLIAAADDFSASVYVNGFRVGDSDNTDGVVGSPAYTYQASSDTYWDLGQDGTWTPAFVANMASEPAVTADSIRVYKVITDGVDRTSVEDRRNTSLEYLAFNIPQIEWPTNDSAINSDRYILIQESPAAEFGLRIYLPTNNSAIADKEGWMLTLNASWNEGSTQWETDNTTEAYALLFDRNGFHYLAHGTGTTWSDAVSAGNWAETHLIGFSGGTPSGITTTNLTFSPVRTFYKTISGADATFSIGDAFHSANTDMGLNSQPAASAYSIRWPVAFLPDGCTVTDITVYLDYTVATSNGISFSFRKKDLSSLGSVTSLISSQSVVTDQADTSITLSSINETIDYNSFAYDFRLNDSAGDLSDDWEVFAIKFTYTVGEVIT